MHVGWLVLGLMAAAPTGRAPLRLQYTACPDIEQATVSRVVTMELQAGLADEQQAGALTTAVAECADGQVRLTIDDPVTGKSTTRTIDLEGQSRGLRSRLLGLAISEAVLASWLELRLARETHSELPGPLAPPETRREAADIAERHLQARSRPRAPTSSEIVAGPGLRWFSSGLLTVGLSGSARRWREAYPVAGFGLDIDGSYGRQATDVAAGSAISLSLAPCLLMRSSFGPILTTAGVGWRMGLARLAAEPTSTLRSGGSAWRGWTGPFLAVDLSATLWRSFLLRVGVETGYAVVPAHGRVDSVPVIALEGSWIGGLLSLGTRF